jgi:hypothetical protein
VLGSTHNGKFIRVFLHVVVLPARKQRCRGSPFTRIGVTARDVRGQVLSWPPRDFNRRRRGVYPDCIDATVASIEVGAIRGFAHGIPTAVARGRQPLISLFDPLPYLVT